MNVDLGCGSLPRKPFEAKEIIGMDLRNPGLDDPRFEFCYPTETGEFPFESGSGDVITAFGFLEHIPRHSVGQPGQTSFIAVMNEIWCTFRPEGIFLGFTPAYPSAAAFSDPTHVNFLQEKH